MDLDKIAEAMWQRFNLGEPEKADIKTVLKALFVRDLMSLIALNSKTLENPLDIIEILRTLADGIELAVLDVKKNH